MPSAALSGLVGENAKEPSNWLFSRSARNRSKFLLAMLLSLRCPSCHCPSNCAAFVLTLRPARNPSKSSRPLLLHRVHGGQLLVHCSYDQNELDLVTSTLLPQHTIDARPQMPLQIYPHRSGIKTNAISLPHNLFLVLASGEREIALLKSFLDVFVHGESNSLARGNTHDARRDALVECVEAFLSVTQSQRQLRQFLAENLLEHISRNLRDTAPGTGSKLGRRLLQPCLDRVDGRVAQGAHRTTNEANACRLPARQVGALVLRLPVLERLLEVAVRGEVDGLVGALTQGCQAYTAVEGADTFLLDHCE